MKLHALFLGLTLAGAVLPAHAGLFDDDEARRRLEQFRQQTENRLQKIESSNDTTIQNQRDLNNQLDRIKQDLAEVRGQVEVVGNDTEQNQQRQNAFYNDLDARLRKLEAMVAQLAAGNGGQAAADQPRLDPSQEPKDYEAAINLVRAGKYGDAATSFRQFIKNWPKSAFLPGAHFWAAESLMRVRDYDGARDYYAKLVSGWPEDQLVPDAMLGLSNAQQEGGDAKAARATLEKLVARFPNSDAGKSAKQRLAKKK